NDFDRWFDVLNNEPRDVTDLLVPPPDSYFKPIPVSDQVNKVANSGADLHVEVAPKDFKQAQSGQSAKTLDDDQPSLF
ncbi:MAG: SOS response-associated peptidase, partial [Pseudomonadota bacterium]